MQYAIVVNQDNECDGAAEDNYNYAVFTLDARGDHAQLVRKYRTYRDACAARDAVNIVLVMQRDGK